MSSTPMERKPDEMAEQNTTPPLSSQEEQRQVLKARAKELALTPQKNKLKVQCLEMIAFRLASETYAIEAEYVREVYSLKDFTPLPGTPPFILGIINLRGQIVSVVDLKKFFHLPERGLGQLNKVLLLQSPEMQFGILADEMIGSLSIPTETIQPPLPTVTGIGAEYIKGISQKAEIILDAAAILGDERMVIDENGSKS